MQSQTWFAVFLGCSLQVPGFAAAPDTVGATPVRNEDATLVGTGIRVAQPEASEAPSAWEVNPASVGQPVALFNWISSGGTTNDFPNALGVASGHAGAVGYNFYGGFEGVAPGVASVDNYEAGYFVTTIIPSLTAIRAQVVNQSFVGGLSLPLGQSSESQYDAYVASYNTVIVSGVGNGGAPQQPATAYNVIAVGAFGGASSIGPTTNGGRAKPDLTAPADVTSFSTPLVSGIAAMLFQAGARNDAGAGTAGAATNAMTLKALLLNGAIKPAGWTNGPTSPLDARYGAGLANAYNSWRQLRGGKRAFIESTSPAAGSHPPGANSGNIAVTRGWDYTTVTAGFVNDGVNHYYFSLDAAAAARFSLTATLVWQRHAGQSSINDLDLFLYRTSTSNQVAASQSTVDNVEHLFLAGLPAGRYDLQVLKHAGLSTPSPTENYALAFDFEPVKLSLASNSGNLLVSWPASATGFALQMAADPSGAGGWSLVSGAPAQTNGQFVVSVPATGLQQFYRLIR